jgi:rhodanese-related sulfurtransferase
MKHTRQERKEPANKYITMHAAVHEKKHDEPPGIPQTQNTRTGMGDADRKWYLGVVFLLSFATTMVIFRTAPLYAAIFRQTVRNVASWGTDKKDIGVRGNETYLTIDPVLVKEYMETNNDTYILVDVRSDAEYRSGHIKRAVSIPLYTDFRRPYGSAVKLDGWEKELRKQTAGKREIVVYGYRPDADIIHIAVDAVRKKSMPVKILSVGYGDWVGGFPQWMPGHEIYGSFNINDYIERMNQ